MTEEKGAKNVWIDDIAFGKDSEGTYEMQIEGAIKGGQIKRSHECKGSGNYIAPTENIDNVEWKEGGSAKYTMKASGKVEGARIARIHECHK